MTFVSSSVRVTNDKATKKPFDELTQQQATASDRKQATQEEAGRTIVESPAIACHMACRLMGCDASSCYRLRSLAMLVKATASSCDRLLGLFAIVCYQIPHTFLVDSNQHSLCT